MANANKYSIETTISAEDFLIGLTSRGWFRRFSGTIITDVADAVNAEASARQAADTALQNNIDAEEAARIAADNTLQQNIDTEEVARQSADNTLTSNLQLEEVRRITADDNLQNNIKQKRQVKIFDDRIDLLEFNPQLSSDVQFVFVRELAQTYEWVEASMQNPATGDPYSIVRPNSISPSNPGRFIKNGEFNQSKFKGVFQDGDTIDLVVGQSAIISEAGTYTFNLKSYNSSITLPGAVFSAPEIIISYIHPITGLPSFRRFPIGGTSSGGGTLPFNQDQIDSILNGNNLSATNPVASVNELNTVESTLQGNIDTERNERIAADVLHSSRLDFHEQSIEERIRYTETITSLRQIDAASITGYIVVRESHDGYRYDANSLAADNGRNVIKPNSLLTSEPGRYIRLFRFNQSSIIDLAYPGNDTIWMNPGESAIVYESGNYTFGNSELGITVNRQIDHASIVRLIQITPVLWDIVVKTIERVNISDDHLNAIYGANAPGADNPFATLNDVSSGSVDVVQKTFTQSVPFDELTSFMTTNQSGTLIFIPDGTNAVDGNRTILTINGNGVHNADFSAFTKSGGSFDFDNTKRNLVMFWKDGDLYWYRIFEQVTIGATSETIDIQNKVYPNAVGYGTESRGAYAGTGDPQILIVDSLAAGSSGSGNRGTFKWACEQQFPRIIVFEVSGVIDYSQDPDWRIQVDSGYINVYGQTAPGKGITIYGNVFWLQATDMLFQHIRFRAGDVRETLNPNTVDTINAYNGTYRVTFDHCSFSWSIDELVGSKPGTTGDFTFTDCIFSEPLDMSWHYDEDTLSPERHSYGCLMNAQNTTFARNLFAYMKGRAPLVRHGYNQIINNLNYNGQIGCPMLENTSEDMFVDIINNHIINIPYMGITSTAGDYAAYIASYLTAASRLHISGNISPVKTANPGFSDWDTVFYNERATEAVTPQTDLTNINILPSEQVFAHVLNNAGAFPWDRDNIDAEIITKVQTDARGEFRHSATKLPATARNEEEGSQTMGNMTTGYDWGTANEDLVISYRLSDQHSVVGPVTLTLNQLTNNPDDVVTLLNSLLPPELSAKRIGNQANPTNWIQINLTLALPGGYIIIHNTGIAHLTLGIEAKTYYSVFYTEVQNISESHTLSLPPTPHADGDANSYTDIEEWAWNQSLYGSSGNVVEPWPFGGGGAETDPVFSASPASNITSQNITDWNNKANSQHNHLLTDITDSGSIASWDIWEGTQAEYDALGTYDPTTLYFIDGALLPVNIMDALNAASAPSGDNPFATMDDVASSGGGTETDPVFSASAAAGITGTDISNWNGKPDTATDIGLGNVDNTSDVDKPVSTAQQTALDGKVDKGDIRTEAGTTYATSATDAEDYIRFTAATAITITVNNILAIGDSVTFRQAGSGVITLAADTGVTLNGDLNSNGQHSTLQIVKVADNIYDVIGGVV